jgi:hypothetical protein
MPRRKIEKKGERRERLAADLAANRARIDQLIANNPDSGNQYSYLILDLNLYLHAFQKSHDEMKLNIVKVKVKNTVRIKSIYFTTLCCSIFV